MDLRENEMMSAHTSLKVGGPSRFFAKAESSADLAEARRFAQEQKIPCFIVGKGTNLLVSDKGFRGLIVQLGRAYSNLENLEGAKIRVGAATPLARLARETINQGFAGMHKLAGIPGSLGGAIYMNAGAYGQEISQTCIEVESVDSEGIVRTRAVADCDFGYRHSIFQELAAAGKGETITAATFQLTEASTMGKSSADLESEMQECMAKRKASQPLNMPNAGSTFKRLSAGATETPTQVAPGYYIEQAGLKGYRIGGAEVSTLHANFIVNASGATAKDIKELSEFVQAKVAEKFGIELKREIILLGEF